MDQGLVRALQENIGFRTLGCGAFQGVSCAPTLDVGRISKASVDFKNVPSRVLQSFRTNLKETTGGEFRVCRASIRYIDLL